MRHSGSPKTNKQRRFEMAAGDPVDFRADFKAIQRIRPGHEIELIFAVENTSNMKDLLAKINMTVGANITCAEGEEDEEQLDLSEGGDDD